jgi:uncharacterized protein YgbK (DUF1537 family)
MPRVLAIADDLTGALEAGAKFAARGFPAIVTTRPSDDPAFPVIVVDTESRILPASEAATRVAAACAVGGEVLYKKTDSTLRGNIGAELRAMRDAWPRAAITYVPAYPAVGRTVRAGVLYVHGVAVGESAFARDAMNPVMYNSVAEAIGDIECTIHDGDCYDDVLRATEAGLARGNPPILAGPASVAETIAELMEGPRQVPPQWPRVPECLIVNGSRHEVSARQVALAESQTGARWQVARLDIPQGATAVQARTAIAGAVVNSPNTTALMIFGGDTAFGILTALGIHTLEPLGEVVPGVPISRVPGRNRTIITKAGGFGDESLIREVWERLHGE